MPAPLQQLALDIDALIDRPGHQHGIWGIAVQSIPHGERLYEHNPQTLLIPASAMKLVTVAVAADAVGWDYRFETRFLAAGRLHGGALQGDLVISGNGDPSVFGRTSDTFHPWITSFPSHGITRIEGRIIADDNSAEEPAPGNTWSWEDLAYPYGALPGALNLEENRIVITVSPSAVPGTPAIIELPPDARGVRVINDTLTVGPDDAQALSPEVRPGEPLRVRGTIPIGARPARVSVSAGNPTLAFARGVRNRLLAAGIDVTSKAIDADDLPFMPDWSGAEVLHVHRSAPLWDIAMALMKDSINLYAEAVLRLATGPDGWRSTGAAVEAARARLEAWGIPKHGIQMVDGSGLSRRNVIAPETLLALLVKFSDPSNVRWMQTMAVAGGDGTLEHRMKGTPAERNAIGKSGSMSNVRTLAGYVTTADRERLAFAIMANNFEGSAAQVTATIDKIVARLASFSRTGPATR